jgi:cytosine/adenosine deaminase-related metal-dependent hydrolase
MNYASGKILTKDGFEKGYIGFNKKKIIDLGASNCPSKPIAKGLIVPTFVNAHTHIGDSFIKQKNLSIPKDIEKLVAPPNGLKFKFLNEASEEEIIDGMESSIKSMANAGTGVFCDFREGGLHGICYLKTAVQLWNISSVILSRPEKINYDKREIDILLRNSDGIGLSSISDWNYSDLTKISKQTKKNNKIFAIHASERVREDIDKILDLKPDFLVHMIKASKSDLERLKENNIPIVICPRSNAFFGLKPNINLMKKIGLEIILGTDNAMLNSASILDEIKYFLMNFKVYNKTDILYKATYVARKVLNQECDILCPNSKAEFVVLDEKTLKPLYISI